METNNDIISPKDGFARKIFTRKPNFPRAYVKVLKLN